MPDTQIHVPAITAPQLRTDDPAKAIGDLFRRLALASETFGGASFDRIVWAAMLALGRAALDEAEREARNRQERDTPHPGEIPVARNVHAGDFDGSDPGDPERPRAAPLGRSVRCHPRRPPRPPPPRRSAED